MSRQKSMAEIEIEMWQAREEDRKKGFDVYDRENCPILFPEEEQRLKDQGLVMFYSQFGWAITSKGMCSTASSVIAKMVDLEAMLRRSEEIKELKKALESVPVYARMIFLEKQKRGEFLNVDSP